MAPVQGTIVQGSKEVTASPAALHQALSDGFFWLDLDGVDEEAAQVLAHDLGIHPLAIEDAQEFGHRPKVEDYGDVTYLVVHGANSVDHGTTEVHAMVGERFVVTVHRGVCEPLGQVRARLERHPAAKSASPQVAVCYLLFDGLIDSFFPVLSDFDDKIDTLEAAILDRPTEEQLGTLFAMKRQLLVLRRVVTPERDMFAALASGVAPVPGATEEDNRYFRDLYDHLIRISDLVDNYRDLLSGVMDTHLAMVSNRLNVVMKQLTIIATIFLPLSFLTGFFGQNFALLVRSISGDWAFWVLGVGLDVVAVIALLYLFKLRGWLGGPTA
jgi:magnesium transporter